MSCTHKQRQPNTPDMQTLPLTFRKSGYDLNQVNREGDIAIYVQSDTDGICGYEVIRVRVAKESVMFGKTFPEREVYPSSEQWGRDGFTVKSIEHALSLAENMKTTPNEAV